MAALERACVLVVEDDASSRDALSKLLAVHGFRVRTAKDGQEALDLMQSGLELSLLIVDLTLPKVSGSQLLKYTHQDPDLRTIPVIVMSATTPMPADLVADLIFPKPVDVPRLIGAVKRLVRRPDLVDEC
jgi:CheY-like chemotaxis protein